MYKKFSVSAGFVAMLSLTQASMAAPVTLYGSISDNSYLSAGSHDLIFDGRQSLSSQFQINSASFSFSFADDSDSYQSTGFQTTGVSYTDWVRYNQSSYLFYRNSTTHVTDLNTGESEGADVIIDGSIVGSGATLMTESSIFWERNTYLGATMTNGLYCPVPNYCVSAYYTTTDYRERKTIFRDWSGGFSVSGVISDPSLLTQLLDTGLLNFNLNVTGDLLLTSSRLFLDVTEITQTTGNDIPEPQSLLLTLAALGGLARFSLRRNSAH